MTLVSVVLPVYNGMPHLIEAVNSIFAQSFTDYELIVVNDASTDGSHDYIHSLADPRLTYIHLKQNLGVTGALRTGLDRAAGKYIARLDADDVALPDRLQVQVTFMESHPEVGLLGSSSISMDEQGKEIEIYQRRLPDIDLRWAMCFKNPFVHSSVIFRIELIRSHGLNYETQFGEDYDLWGRILEYSKGYISDDVLIRYRISLKSWTYTKQEQQEQSALTLARQQIEKYLAGKSNLNEFIQWSRTGQLSGQSPEEMRSLFLTMLTRFIQCHYREGISASFIGQKIGLLRKRTGLLRMVQLNKPLMKIYLIFVYFKIKSFFESK